MKTQVSAPPYDIAPGLNCVAGRVVDSLQRGLWARARGALLHVASAKRDGSDAHADDRAH